MRRPRFVSSPARRSTSKTANRKRPDESLACRIAGTSSLDAQGLLLSLIGHICIVQVIVVQGWPCGQCGSSAPLRNAEDAFLEVFDSLGFARVPTFQQERIAYPLPRI